MAGLPFPRRRRALRERPGHLPRLRRRKTSNSLAVEHLEDRRLLAVQAFPVPLQPLDPSGAMVYHGTTGATIDAAPEVESFTIDVDEGQTITLVVDPEASLTAKLQLSDPTFTLLGTATSAGAGLDVALQSLPTATAGTYTIDVLGAGDSTGDFNLRLIVNATVEAEAHDGANNDTFVAAEDLEPTFVTPGSSRAAVLGTHPVGAGVSDDWYQFQLDDAESTSLTLNSSGTGTGTLELYDSDATTRLAVGSPVSSFDQAISNFRDATTDLSPNDYFVRVVGNDINYTLVATQDTTLETEPNNSANTPQDITFTGAVLGHVVAGDDDFFRVEVNANDVLTIKTMTPADGQREPVNILDPQIEVLDPTGTPIPHTNLAGNETFNHTALLDGGYLIRLFSSADSGEYSLEVDGHTGAPPVFAITTSDPADGAALKTPPPNITVHFTDDVLLTSVDAADLAIDGTAVSSVTIVDGNTLTFDLPAVSEGVHTITIAANALTDLQGQPHEAFSSQFTLDETPPQVTSSSLLEGDVVPAGNLTYTAVFSELLDEATLTANDLQLVGVSSGSQIPTSFAYNGSTSTVTVEYAHLPVDSYALRLLSGDGQFEDVVGNDLDGERAAGTTVPSGDGNPGGDFVINFTTDPAFTVTFVDPADGAVLLSAPTMVTLDFSDDVDVNSVQSTDLELDGNGALSVTIVDSDTLIFDLSTVSEGVHTITIGAGALVDLRGQPLEAFSSQFTLEDRPPQVTSSSLLEGDVVPAGNLTYTALFSKLLNEATLTADDLQLVGTSSGSQVPTSFAYDGSTSTLTVEYANLPVDGYALTLLSGDGQFEDVVGNDLDGEPAVGTTVPSGDGNPGGDFVIHFTTDPAFTVTVVDPADGAMLPTAPTEVTLDLNDDVDSASVQATDLEIDGSAALSVTIVDSDTLTFGVAAMSDGVHTITIAAGALIDLQGQPLEAFSSQFTLDETPPQITSSSLLEGDVVPAGNLTYTALFSKLLNAATLTADDLQLVGVSSGSQVPTSFAYDGSTSTLTVEYANLPVDGYALTLLSGDGQFEDVVGNDLDGEPAIGTTVPSGDGNPGGDFVVHFTTDPAFTVTVVDPADGAILPTAPTEVTLDFNDELDANSVQATDLEVDGVPATSVSIVDSDTLSFGLPTVSAGGHTITIAAGALADQHGQLLEAFSSQFTLDQIGPQVTSSSLLEGDVVPAGNLTYTAVFSELLDEATLTADDLQLVGVSSGSQVPTGFSYDGFTSTLIVGYANLLEDSYTLTLLSGDGQFEDLAGSDLDGEPAAGTTVPSGDGNPGGNFRVNFSVDAGASQSLGPFVRQLPLGSLVRASLGNTGLINATGDVDQLLYTAQAGETVAMILTPDNSLATVSLELPGVTGLMLSSAPGRPIILPPTPISALTPITIRVKGDTTTAYSLDVLLNTTIEEVIGDAGDGNELDLGTSLLEIGSRRLAVRGHSQPVTVPVGSLTQEANDTLGSAVLSGVMIDTGVDLFEGSGEIGDNLELPSTMELDVDLIELELKVGDRVTIDVDAQAIGSSLDAFLTLFTSDGQIVAQNDDFGSSDPFIDYTATVRGSYFVGVSGFANGNYDPFIAGSGIAGSTGLYELVIQRNPTGGSSSAPAEVTLPDIDEYTFDAAGLTSGLIDVVLSGQDGVDLSGQLLELLGPDGTTVLASASPDPLGVTAENYDQAILGFVVPADGVYTLRLSSVVPGDYVLLVTQQSFFESQPNATMSDPLRALSSGQRVMGYLETSEEASGLSLSELQILQRMPGATAELVSVVVESEPNDTILEANPIPLGFDTGKESTVEIEGQLDGTDTDFFGMSLEPGDILSAATDASARLTLRDSGGVELVGSAQNVGYAYPEPSPLLTTGSAVLAWVVDTVGDYFISIEGTDRPYGLNLSLFRPGLESTVVGTRQKLFLDFDGETFDTAIFDKTGDATLSPLSTYLPNWGLAAADENAVIDAIIATVEENISSDIRAFGKNGDYATSGVPGEFDIEIINSRDHSDPFGEPNVSRVIVGGSIAELGLSVIGRAELIDTGNYATEETAVVLLDLLSAPSPNPNSLNKITLDPSVSIIDLIGVGVGNIISHEAGHILGHFHTYQFNSQPSLSDQGGSLNNFIGLVGPVWGDGSEVDVDFVSDIFAPNEGFTGTENTRELIAFGLSSGTVAPAMNGPTILTMYPPAGIQGADDITTLTIEFDETITAATANDPANYMLIKAGPTGVFEGGQGMDMLIPLTPVFDGDRIVELTIDSSFSPLPFGQYQLTVDGDTSIEDLDGNPLNSTTGPGGGEDEIHHFEILSFIAGNDLYQFELSVFETIVIETATPLDDPGSSSMNNLNPLLVIYDSSGAPVAFDNDSRDGKNASIVFQAAATDTYTIQVLAQSGEGEYQLEVMRPSVPGDYNYDGVVGAEDFSVWRDSLGRFVLPLTGADGDADGMIDEGDFDVWKANYGAVADSFTVAATPVADVDDTQAAAALRAKLTTLPVATFSLPGDYDLNGIVDTSDYSLWRNTRGQLVPSQAGADGNGDGVVNDHDFEIWKDNFGATTASLHDAAVQPTTELVMQSEPARQIPNVFELQHDAQTGTGTGHAADQRLEDNEARRFVFAEWWQQSTQQLGPVRPTAPASTDFDQAEFGERRKMGPHRQATRRAEFHSLDHVLASWKTDHFDS